MGEAAIAHPFLCAIYAKKMQPAPKIAPGVSRCGSSFKRLARRLQLLPMLNFQAAVTL
jgi:hypothetical protein